jgi:hypothetical protein
MNTFLLFFNGNLQKNMDEIFDDFFVPEIENSKIFAWNW